MPKRVNSKNHALVLFNRDRTLIRYYYSHQSGTGSDGNKEVLCIPQSSSITGTSPSDCLVSYAEVQSVYSTAPDDWASF